YFVFQAEDGIRDRNVTGVQTCALPILSDDEEQAERIATRIEELNNERKELTSKVYEDCLAQVEKNGWQHRNTLVIYNPDFHEGEIGRASCRERVWGSGGGGGVKGRGEQ